MRISRLLFIFFVFVNLVSGQQQRSLQGRVIGEYLPKMFSSWNNATLGGQIFYKLNLTSKQYFVISADGRFVPTSSKQLKFNYQKQFGVGYSLVLAEDSYFSLNIYGGVNYSLVSNNKEEQAFFPSFLQFNYSLSLTDNTRILTSFINIYEIHHSNFTNSLRVGFEVYKSFYISIDLLQFINWGNKETQIQNNLFSPYFY